MSRILSRLSVGHQINLLSALGVVGLIIAGVIYYDGSAKVATQQGIAAEALETEQLVARVDYDLLLARRAEKDFLIRLEPSYVEAQVRLRSTLADALSALKKQLSENDEVSLAARTDGLKAGVDRYFAQFAKVAELQTRLGLNENSGAQGDLRGAVHAVETKLATTTEPQLTILMLMMRRHEKDFIARRDPAYTTQMTARGTEFAAALKSTGLAESDKTEMAANMARYQATFADFAKGTLAVGAEIKELSRLYSEVEPVVQTMSKDIHTIYVAAQQAAERRQADTGRLIGGAIAVITILVGLMGWMIGRGIRRPLLSLSDVMRRLAQGEHTIAVDATERRDEIGSMSRAVLVFRDGLLEADQLRSDQESMRAQAEQDRRQLLAELADECETSMGVVANAVSSSATQLRTAAEMLSGAAGRAAERSSAVSVGATETSANVQTVAAATEELTHSIEEITRQVADASSIAATAVAEAELTNTTVGSLNDAAERIGSVVALITQIANQTNLLALNATIEAARAGEAGKGFAVVAAEVKSLAGQTARATSEIQNHVLAIQQESGQATQAIGDIGGTIGRLNEISVAVAAAVRQQSAATAEISRNVQQAAQATEQVTEHIADVEESTRITGNSAGELLNAAQGLTDQATNLQRNVTALGARIRAA